MTRKKKSTAQDLIDSLLDDSGDARPSSALAPPLPGEASGDLGPRPDLPAKASLGEESFAKSIRFEFDPGKAEPSLKLVDERTQVQSRDAKKAGSEPAAPTAMTPSQVQNAPTMVVRSAKSVDLFSPEDSMKFEIPQREPSAEGLPEATGAVDKTMRLPEKRPAQKSEPSPAGQSKPVPRPRPVALPAEKETGVRFGMGTMGIKSQAPPTGAVFTSAEASLKQSESLRIAQMRIHELEQELDRIRRENEKLASAGETLRRRVDELLAKQDSLESQNRDSQQIHDEEKKVVRGQIAAKERENTELRAKIEEAETRLEANFKRIRVRERELEHRLEIVKMENSSLISTKDEMIMRLKREIDQLKFETENGKVRSQELYNQYKEKQETIGRVVRALRIALTILEGDDPVQSKKSEE